MAAYPPVFRVICHLDMDAFYASVEQRDNQISQGVHNTGGMPSSAKSVACFASTTNFCSPDAPTLGWPFIAQ